MAVTLTPENFIHPAGELQRQMFASQVEMESALSAWIDEAEAKVIAVSGLTDENGAAAAWVYHRAYAARAQALANQPDSEALRGELTRSIGQNRIAYFERRAAEWLTEYQTVTALPAGRSPIGYSGGAVLKPVW